MVFIPWIPKRLAPPKEESSGSLSFLSDCMTLYRAILGQTNRFIYSHLDWASTVIESEALGRIKAPGIRSYPDRLSDTIEQCILMKLVGIPFDMSLLGKYAEFSPCLQFILNPLEFDYTQVDTRNVMWHNLMYSDEYGKYFKMNKETILTDELQQVLRGGLATVAQQKVVYGLLLDRDELRGY